MGGNDGRRGKFLFCKKTCEWDQVEGNRWKVITPQGAILQNYNQELQRYLI